MLSCVLTTITAFIGNANGSEAVTLATSLPTVGLSIMVLLALSSYRARQYAVRGRHARKHIAGRTYEQAAIGSSVAVLHGARCGTPRLALGRRGVRQSLSWRMPRAFLPGSMIQAAHANPMSAIPSSVLRPGRS